MHKMYSLFAAGGFLWVFWDTQKQGLLCKHGPAVNESSAGSKSLCLVLRAYGFETNLKLSLVVTGYLAWSVKHIRQ